MDEITPRTAFQERFTFIGGQRCLDFANTVGGLRGGLAQENLSCYADLLAWSQQASLLSEGEATALLRQATGAAEEAAVVLERAYALREAIYRIFSSIAAGAHPLADDLEALNRELKPALAEGRVVATAEGFDWAWGAEALRLDQMLPPLARAAATLLTSAERSRVRQCASSTCGWLFVDATKNHRRQWCSMTGCGNKARVRRHRQRQRAGQFAD